MEDKYREIMEQLLYQISNDIYSLLDEDSENIVEAISDLSEKVGKLSDDMWEEEITYKCTGWNDLKFSLT